MQVGPMPTVNVTQESLYVVLRSFILNVTGIPHVVKSQGNRVPMPKGDFATMTPMGTTGLSTAMVDYSDASGTGSTSRDTQWRCQIDFYGTSAADNCAALSTMVRSLYAADFFRDSPLSPLYSSEPLQTSMVNGEDQWEDRWTMDFIGQFNPAVIFPVDFIESATLETELANP